MKKLTALLMILVLMLGVACYAAPAFEDSSLYTTVTGMLDESFSEYDHDYYFDSETDTFYIYLALGAGTKSVIVASKDNPEIISSWAELTTNFKGMTTAMIDVVDEGIEDGLIEDQPVNCTIMLVETIHSDREYDTEDMLCCFTNGEAVYDALSE